MKKVLVVFLIFSSSFNYAQNLNSIFSNDSEELNTKSNQSIEQLGLTDLENLSYTPVESAIDPETYILGPGDLLGISIITTLNISLPIRVNPVGEIMIPSVGVVNVNGKSLHNAKDLIIEYIKRNAFQNAIVDVTLLDIKRFKIQLLGAVNNPGYVYVSSIDGIYETITNNGGVQKFADQNIIHIRRDGETIEVSLSKYLSENDQSQNIFLQLGDIIFVPFTDYAQTNDLVKMSINNNQVIVYGFVNKNNGGNAFRFFPGYKVRDYIALAGGTTSSTSSFSMGNVKKAKIYRADGTILSHALEEIVLPGDIIEVPPRVLYQIVGSDGIIKTLSSIASIASSAYIIFKITQDR